MTAVAMGRESARVRTFATSVATYEIVALWTDLPTVSRLVTKYPPLGLGILLGLSVHFYAPRRRT